MSLSKSNCVNKPIGSQGNSSRGRLLIVTNRMRRGLADAEKPCVEGCAEMVNDGKVVVSCEFCSSVCQFTPQETGVEEQAATS